MIHRLFSVLVKTILQTIITELYSKFIRLQSFATTMEISPCFVLTFLYIGLTGCHGDTKLEDVMARLESLELWKQNAQREIAELKEAQNGMYVILAGRAVVPANPYQFRFS